ncbi:MAG: hypothetical protein AAB573_03170 [Patescibacteria group bacterium]
MVKTQKVALAIAAIAVVVHVVWSIVVAIGLGQWWVDFILGLHFLQVPVVVQSFDIVTAIELWVVVGVVGYIVGFVIAHVWNWVHK